MLMIGHFTCVTCRKRHCNPLYQDIVQCFGSLTQGLEISSVGTGWLRSSMVDNYAQMVCVRIHNMQSVGASQDFLVTGCEF